MRIKMFATDMDGTLLVDHTIPIENANALHELAKKDVEIVFASGRVLSSMQTLASSIDLPCHFVASNGALVVDKSGKVLSGESLSLETVTQLVALCEKHHLYYHFYDADTLYAPTLNFDRLIHLRTVDAQGRDHWQVNLSVQRKMTSFISATAPTVYKFQIQCDDSRAHTLFEAFEHFDALAITRSGTKLVEVMAAGVNKWRGLERLASNLGIEAKDVSAIGDYDNDLEMITHSGVGIAMGNAPKHIQQQAKIVTTDNKSFGVAEAIRTHFI